MTPGPLLVADVARLLKCSPATVRAHLDSGRLHGADISPSGRRAEWRIRPADVDAFLAARPAPRGAAPKPGRRARRRAAEWFP